MPTKTILLLPFFLKDPVEQKRMAFWYENVMDSVLIEPPLEELPFWR